MRGYNIMSVPPPGSALKTRNRQNVGLLGLSVVYAFLGGLLYGRYAPAVPQITHPLAASIVSGLAELLLFAFWPTLILTPAIMAQVCLRPSIAWMTASIGSSLLALCVGFELNHSSSNLLTPFWESVVIVLIQVPVLTLVTIAAMSRIRRAQT
jgi:hypothetical protein